MLVDFPLKKEEELRKARGQLQNFTTRFPFRLRPEIIDNLKAADVYEKGSRDSFLYWVEFGTFDVAHISVFGASIYENVKNNLTQFKSLLKTAVNDSVSLHEKVDAPWDAFRGFGGDRHIAKKIIALFYPEKVLPILNTKYLEHFALKLGLRVQDSTRRLFQRDYDDLTVGEKFEVYHDMFSKWKEEKAPGVDNLVFAKFLYTDLPPPEIPTQPQAEIRSGTLGFMGHLFEPENELGVVSLFSMYHSELGFPFILSIQNSFPDATIIDNDRRTVKAEFEYKASNFIQHEHPSKGCDLIVCWENDLPQTPGPEILALKDEIPRVIKNRFLEE